MDAQNIRPKMRVRITHLTDTRGMAITQEHLRWRRAGALGLTESWVPGHGGDVWWVRQDDGKVTAYTASEMEPA